MKSWIAGIGLLVAANAALADVTISDHDTLKNGLRAKAASHALQAGDKPGFRMSEVSPHPNATGSISLIDASGLKYFINTNITFNTTSSASGAQSEASYTHAIAATTSAGGTTSSTLNDAFDGYGALCVSLTGASGPCSTGDANYTMYNQNGAAAFDTGVPATAECTNRQVVFPDKTIGGLTVSRKIFVPTDDNFSRTLDIVSNPTAAPITATLILANNLGSDSSTRVVTSSSGDNVVTTADTWVTTFQNFSGNTSSDPRLGHVLQGAGALVPVSTVNFVDGDDNPFWGYTVTVPPGGTQVLMHFVTAVGTKAAAAAQAARLAALPASATQCLSPTEIAEVVNFATDSDVSIVKTAPTSVDVDAAFDYTLSVSSTKAVGSATVTDTLDPALTFVSATGTGWNCGFAAGVVTCTSASTLAPGAAAPITVSVTAPHLPATISNTATVASSATETAPANNSSTVQTSVVPADLGISKSSPAIVNAGATFDFTITVGNIGATASNVTVSDTLPANVTYLSASGTGWTCNVAAGVLTCTLPSLAIGSAAPITLSVVAPNVASAVTNTASVSSATFESNTANNSSTTSTTVISPASVSGTKTVRGDFQVNGAIVYTIVLHNAGPSNQQDNPGNELLDVLPSDLTLISASSVGGLAVATTATNTVTWNGALAAGANATITINATINAGAAGHSINNQAVISYDADGNGSNESNTATDDPAVDGAEDPTAFVVAANADLGIVLTPPATPIMVGTSTTFTGTLSNGGPDPAVNASATITFPAGFTVLSASAAGYICSIATNVVTCTAASVPVGASSTLSITVRPPNTPTTGTVSGTITSDTTDPAPANNTSNLQFAVVVPSGPPAVIPTLGGYALLGLIAALALMPLFLRRRRTSR